MFNTVILLVLACLGLLVTYRASPSAIVYFEWSPRIPLKNDVRATPGKSPVAFEVEVTFRGEGVL